MPQVIGLTGLRPKDGKAAKLITTPPYDVIDLESDLEKLLKTNPDSMYHVILGKDPKKALAGLVQKGLLVEDNKPCFYVYEQRWNDQSRLGILVAAEVSGPKEGKIRDHEDTFPDKVKGRIKLAEETGYTTGPVFCFVKSEEDLTQDFLKALVVNYKPLLDFTSDFNGLSDLHGIENRIFRISQESADGRLIQQLLNDTPLYIGRRPP